MPEKGAAPETLTALLVDDEKLAREELAFLLRSFPQVDVIGQAANGPDALAQIEALDPDIVFMDVQMPGLSGLEVARQLVAAGNPPHIIFATAFDQYAVEAFEVHAADYLLKPVEKPRLERSLERAAKILDSSTENTARMEQLLSQISDRVGAPNKVLVRANNRMLLVDASDVIFAKVRDGSIWVVAEQTEGLSNHKTLDELQATLGERSFWRAHRSYLVNIDRIKEVVPWFKSSYQLRMTDRDTTEVPVSRAQTKRLRELFRL